MKKKRLKHHLHQQKQNAYRQKVTEQLRNRKPINGYRPLFEVLPYVPNLTAKDLNVNYQQFVAPIVDAVLNLPVIYNHNDSRMVLHNADLFANQYGRNYFTGIVVGRGYNIKDHHVSVTLLIKDVRGLVVQANGRHQLKYLTDHLWIDISDFSANFEKDIEQLEVGYGDYIRFTGEVTAYKGYLHGLPYTKYNVTDPIIVDAGYPDYQIENDHVNAINMLNCIPYAHHQHYIVRYYNLDKFPTSFPEFGDQISPGIQHIKYHPMYHFTNQVTYLIRPTINEGYQHLLEDRLILNQVDLKLSWESKYYQLQPHDEVLGTVQDLKRLGFTTFYQRLVDKYHWHYEKFTIFDPIYIKHVQRPHYSYKQMVNECKQYHLTQKRKDNY